MGKKELVLDTSFLLGIFEKKRPLSVSHVLELVPSADLVTLTPCVAELELKAKEGNVIAKRALQALEELGVRIVEAQGPADDALIEYASTGSKIVVTLDNALKSRCLERGIPVIYLRAGKKFVLEGLALFRS